MYTCSALMLLSQQGMKGSEVSHCYAAKLYITGNISHGYSGLTDKQFLALSLGAFSNGA